MQEITKKFGKDVEMSFCKRCKNENGITIREEISRKETLFFRKLTPKETNGSLVE